MRREAKELEGLRLFTAPCFPDERGFLLQSFVRSDLAKLGIPADFHQAIQSRSHRGVVRGLHFQWDPPQGKLVRCVAGRVFDVVVDVRRGSATLGDHTAVELSGENHRVLWVPPGFAHGFMALEDGSILLYECTSEWAPEGAGGIFWRDPDLAIAWPDLPAVVSEKDQHLPNLSVWLEDPRSDKVHGGRELAPGAPEGAAGETSR